MRADGEEGVEPESGCRVTGEWRKADFTAILAKKAY
jgi:hypothetical protein